jgi:glycosyltransferase 2 family protein
LFRSRQFIIGIVISLAFLVWALSDEDWGKVWSALVGASYWALLPALGLYFAGVLVRAFRWRILLRPIVPDIGLSTTFKIVVIGYMANNVLPARIGELVRAYALSRRTGVRKTSTLATIFVERVFDGLTMIAFAAAVLLFVLVYDRSMLRTGGEGSRLGTLLTDYNLLFIIGSVLFLGALIAFILVASSKSRAERAIAFFVRLMPGRLRERGERLAASFVDGLGSLRSGMTMFVVFLLSILAWVLETGMYYVLGRWGFELVGMDGDALPFYAYMLATSLANLSTLIPQAPGYVGVFDAVAQVVLASAFGADSEAATSFVLVLHIALLLPVTVLGFFYLARESLTWKDLTGLEKTRATAARQAHEMEGPLSDIELVQEGKISEGEGEAERRLERAGEGGQPA